ncbi:MAG TPA: CHAT domain-containing protein [Blastocatellia bacterium]|nr:CHAT domain-containing protein [Blastocatellia bacterium]
MKDSKFYQAAHPPETLIAAYAIGKCSPEVQAEIDEHCFNCESCRTRLSILLRLSSLDGNEIERRELERLFPLGKETIAQARQPIGYFPESSIKGNLPLQAALSNQHLATSKKPFNKKAYAMAAITFSVIAIVGIGYYWYAKSHSPVQNSLLAMQRSYENSRPLEARLSGELAYKPYARSRGNLGGSDINRDQINYALAELTRVVASNPTPQERHALGRLYLFLGKFDEAEIQMKTALDTLKNDAALHTDLATLYYERSNYTDGTPATFLSEAIEHYKLAIEIDPQLAEAWFNRALCYEKLSIFHKAKEDWIQYLKIDSKVNSKWAEEAREHLKKLDAKANSVIDPKKKEILLTSLENALNANDNEALLSILSSNPTIVTDVAINNLTEQYLVASLNNNQQQADTIHTKLTKIGDAVLKQKGDSFIADLTELATRASPEIKNRMLSVHLKLRQADKELSRSAFDSAFNIYQAAFLTSTQIGDDLHAEIAVSNLIRYSHSRPNSNSLIALGSQFISKTEKHRHKHLQAQIHAALANAYLSSQQGTLALENSLRATAIAKEIGDKNLTIAGLVLAGTAYTRSGNYKLGLNKSFEALSMLSDNPINSLRNIQAYQQLWEPLFSLGNYELALDYQKEALNASKALNYGPGITGTMGRIGLNLWKLDQNVEAEKYLNTAIERCNLINDVTQRQLLQAELFTALGDVSLSLGKTTEALKSYKFALDVIKPSNNSVYLSAIHQGLASAHIANNNIPDADSELQLSISLLEKSRKQITDVSGRNVFLSRSQNAYKAMVDFQYHIKGNKEAAFNYAEIARNRNVLDTLTRSDAIKTLDGRISLTLSSSSRSFKLKEIQGKMPDNSQILSYLSTEKGLIIWIITSRESFSTTVSIRSDDIEAKVNDYSDSMYSRQGIKIVNQKSSELYQILISPIITHLDDKKTLYIVQDNILSRLPFATLHSASTNRYLIEDFSIATNQSATILVKTEDWAKLKRFGKDETFMGVSNPRFSHQRFPGFLPLPSSEDEVERISSLYKHSKVFNQENAVESDVLQHAQHFNIVHFATHTLTSDADNLASALILAEENLANKSVIQNHLKGIRYDGILQAFEIYPLSLPKAKLIILSSCRSGLGDNSKGEPVGAIAQAFLAIKIPSVIASLWDIDDQNASDLMYEFHYNHAVNRTTFTYSLRKAQCSFIYNKDINKRHPYYWGAFQILGAGL